ncbi:MAG: cellulase family glycosylhydrolase [Ruminococcus sp.]|nr:cellulase family glycosylhydrolase [Ruminococcus sp.]
MRGVNIAHCWYKDKTEQSIKAAADLGTNCVRIVCSNGVKWDKTTASEIKQIIEWCKENKQVCILEVHDATGSNEISDIVKAAEYWTEMKDILNENAKYVIVNIANEWYGDWQNSTWAEGCKEAIGIIRDAGIKNMIIADCAGWGQYPTSIKEKGAEVFAADPDKNTVFSIHMYEYAGGTATMVKDNIDGALKCGAPVIVGEFGLKHSDGDVDEATVMSYCEQNDMGYIAWSWMGNSGGVEYLDLVSSWDGSKLTEWGEIYFAQIKNNSSLASVYTNTSVPTDANYGDANCDGAVDIADAVLLKCYLINGTKYTLSDEGTKNADVFETGSGLNVQDALAIQKYVLKLETELPIK